jgi:predicted transcriptional regulator
MAKEINLDELFAEYARFGALSEPSAKTAVELAEDSGMSEQKIHHLLRHAKRDGILRVCWKTEETIHGLPCHKPAYWIERPAAGKKEKK